MPDSEYTYCLVATNSDGCHGRLVAPLLPRKMLIDRGLRIINRSFAYWNLTLRPYLGILEADPDQAHSFLSAKEGGREWRTAEVHQEEHAPGGSYLSKRSVRSQCYARVALTGPRSMTSNIDVTTRPLTAVCVARNAGVRRASDVAGEAPSVLRELAELLDAAHASVPHLVWLVCAGLGALRIVVWQVAGLLRGCNRVRQEFHELRTPLPPVRRRHKRWLAKRTKRRV